ncbi:LysR family transcriptional regulator, partial [Variovorax paradoxus]|uniref:LysR family transcriptional regulator n=2 Tax=Variovorax TaxID=34072 RepID=UPI001ABBEDC3
MKLKHIEVFNAIMLSGSVSAAARILNVTQPAVTQTLKHAEQQLGYALFVRDKGGMKPTPEARQLHLRAQKI